MKKITTIIFAIFITMSIFMFSACSNDSLKPIKMSVYFNNNVTATTYKNDVSSNKTLNIGTLTSSKADRSKMDKYLDFTFSANGSWIYKMYIDRIEFYVLSNETTSSQMTITLNITNTAKETNLTETSTHTDIKSHNPQKNIAQKYTFKINKVIATATGSTFTLDIGESSELISTKNNPDNNFCWIIYDFKIIGESREYSK